MRLQSLKKLLTSDWHFVGVILFFILHGYVNHGNLLPLRELGWLWMRLLVAGLVVFALSKVIFKSSRKAGLFTSVLCIISLFFGVAQDFLASFQFLAPLSRLQVFLTIAAIILLLVFIILKRTKRQLNKPLIFINVLLAIYIVVDIATLPFSFTRDERRKAPAGNAQVQEGSYNKPSVYLVVLDEYMGTKALQDFFGYNNAWFENQLRQQGFHVVQHPASNYQTTIFSMASLLNMDYVKHPGKATIDNHYAYNKALTNIKDNEVCVIFERLGYRIANYSPFNVQQAAAGYSTGLLPDEAGLLTSQTIWYRVAKDLPAFLLRKGWAKWMTKKLDDHFVHSNAAMMRLALENSAAGDSIPTFNYLHLTMPHAPYAFDSTGKRNAPVALKSLTGAQANRNYLQYLVYANKTIGKFIENLHQRTKGKAVILLMSDHGYRFSRSADRDLPYQNLNAVYLPGKQYAGFYDGMTNVNQFRVLFNTLYQQQLPLLKDSLVYY